MASYCNALGMRVVAWSQNLSDERALAAGATAAGATAAAVTTTGAAGAA